MILALFLLLVSSVPSAYAAIQHVAGSDGSGQITGTGVNLVVTLGSSSTAGDMIVCGVGTVTSGLVGPVKDSANQTYTKITNVATISSPVMRGEIFVFANSVSGVTTVTATGNGSTGTMAMGCGRFTGSLTSSVVDGSGVINSGTSSIPTAAAFTPAVANELLVTIEIDTGTTANTAGGSATLFYALGSITGSANDANGEWQVLVGTPTTTMSFGNSEASWATLTVGFKPLAAACANTMLLVGAGC